jgi:Flp pilus assembly protein TadD
LGLARLLARTGREQEASGWFERACHDHPESGAAQNDLGLCYAQCDRPSDALAPFVRAVVLQPERVLYRNNMARVFVELGSYPEALAQLLAVHEPAVAHYNTGYLLQQSGQSLQAAEQFRKAAEIDPDLEPARKWSEQLAHRQALRGRTAAAQPGGRDATGYRQLQ